MEKRAEMVAAYVRVSTEEQKLHGLSLDAQKMKLQEYADTHNLNIVEWYMDEGISGRKLIRNRPELQRMIHDAVLRKFERIIFIKLDRFFRSVAEYHECMKLIDPVLWTATEEKYDLTTANGRAFVNMKLTIAELEADQTGERIRLVNEYKVKNGSPLFGDASLPFCYMVKDIGGAKIVAKNPETEHIMEDLLAYFFMKQSKRSTVLYINEKYGLSLSYNTVTKVLSNTLICGVYRDNHSYCEPYITEEEFAKLQDILKRNIKSNTADKRAYLFSGLIICPHCGHLLKGAIIINSHRSGKKYRYKKYRCAKWAMNNTCDFNKAVGESVIERIMLENIEDFFEEEKIKVSEITDAEHVHTTPSVEEIQREIDRLNYSWQKGRIKDVEVYDKQYDDLMAKLENAIALQKDISKRDLSHVEEILKGNWKEIYNALDDEHKRSFWRSFVRSIEIDWSGKEKKILKVNFF